MDRRGWTISLLVVLACVEAAAAAAVIRAFVYTVPGQRAEAAALAGNAIGRDRIAELVDTVLNPISVLAVVVAIAAVTFIALARGRIQLALAAGALIIGANLTTQVLKNQIVVRPELGVDWGALTLNSLPSGHTTVAASVAMALVLVLPPRLRGWAALLGTGYAGMVGVATLAAGWHRPSDVIVSYLVTGTWAALASAAVVAARPAAPRPAGGGHPLLVMLFCLGGLLLLIAGGVALREVLGFGTGDYTRSQLLVAYAGGVSALTGVVCWVMAALVALMHRVVPVEQRPAEQRRMPAENATHQ